jgi:hypothetical protein
VGTLKLIQKKTGLTVAKRQIRGSEEETKLRVLGDLVKRWGLKWEEDER